MPSNETPIDAMLLSAGLGTRLRPLTESKPKPLIEVCGKTLIERNLELLSRAGIQRVFINLHYLGEQIRDFVGDGRGWGLEVQYAEEKDLLDTGGGIKNIAHRVESKHLLTLNSDVLIAANAPIRELVEAHVRHQDKPLATMLLRRDPKSADFGQLVVNESGEILQLLDVKRPCGVVGDGAEGEDVDEESTEALMFAGIQVLDCRIFEDMPAVGEKFSITRDTLCRELSKGGLLRAFKYQGFWSDIGTIERLQEASKEVAEFDWA